MHSLTKLDSLVRSSGLSSVTAFLICLRIRRVGSVLTRRFSGLIQEINFRSTSVNIWHHIWKRQKLVTGESSFSRVHLENDRAWLHLNSRLYRLLCGSMSRLNREFDLYKDTVNTIFNITKKMTMVTSETSDLWLNLIFKQFEDGKKTERLQICIPCLHHLTIRGSSEACEENSSRNFESFYCYKSRHDLTWKDNPLRVQSSLSLNIWWTITAVTDEQALQLLMNEWEECVWRKSTA